MARVPAAVSLAAVWAVACEPAVSRPPAEEWRRISSAGGELPMPTRAGIQTASLVGDLDGDGDQDIVIGSRLDTPSVVWLRREPDGWKRYVIEDEELSVEAGGVAFDVDGDGDLDLVLGSDHRDERVWWWENPHPAHAPDAPWTRRLVKEGGGARHHDQVAGDFDGDGAAELVFWNQGSRRLLLAEVPEDPAGTEPWPLVPIFAWEVGELEGLAAGDIDGDGRLDFAGGGRWFRHLGGTRYEALVIDEGQAFGRVAIGQLKAGGWSEVVFVPGDAEGPLVWYEWTGEEWVGHPLLDRSVRHGHSLQIADVDGDGHLDILCAEMRQWLPDRDDNPAARTWLFLGNGRGDFRVREIASGIDHHETRVADLDADGDLDLLVKPYRRGAPGVEIWLNQGSARQPLDRWRRRVVDASRPGRSVFVAAGDVDGDGLPDIVTGAWWYRNPGAADGAWERRTIPLLGDAAILHDLDGDGRLDVLGTGPPGEDGTPVVWVRNAGAGRFDDAGRVAEGAGDFLQGIAVAPFGGRGLQVALSWHAPGAGLQLLDVPDDPAGGPWPQRRLAEPSQDEALSAADVDGDGRPDLLLGTAWLRNAGEGWERLALDVTTEPPDRNRLADVNGDGRLDAIVGFEAISRPGRLAWYERPENPAALWRRHEIAEPVGPMSLDAADLDGDGDMDVVVGEHDLRRPGRARLLVFENLDGAGTSWRPHLVHRGDEHHDGALLVDIDRDGDLDILSIGWGHPRVLLYENGAR